MDARVRKAVSSKINEAVTSAGEIRHVKIILSFAGILTRDVISCPRLPKTCAVAARSI